MWFKLNQDTQICINSTVGMSDTASVGDCIGQGMARESLMSQGNIGLGLQKHFGMYVCIYSQNN